MITPFFKSHRILHWSVEICVTLLTLCFPLLLYSDSTAAAKRVIHNRQLMDETCVALKN